MAVWLMLADMSHLRQAALGKVGRRVDGAATATATPIQAHSLSRPAKIHQLSSLCQGRYAPNVEAGYVKLGMGRLGKQEGEGEGVPVDAGRREWPPARTVGSLRRRRRGSRNDARSSPAQGDYGIALVTVFHVPFVVI